MSKDNTRNKRSQKKKKGERIDPHRQRESARYDQPIASREFIISTLRAEPGPVDFEALAQKLDLPGDEVAMEALRRRVGAMIRDGQLIQNRRRGLVPVDADNLLAGRVTAHPDGFGFVIIEDSDKDIYLNGKQMRQVLHGDRVVVCVTGVDHRGRREGRIVDVVERANLSLVGRLSIDRGTVVVLPDNKRIHQDLLIAPGELGEAQDGDMVVAEIIEQPTRRHQPVGRISEVLGQHLRPGMEIDVALHSHGIPAQWPDEVLEQAAAFSTTVPAKAAKGRTDVRETSLITIDGADARDFDDAVWCEKANGGWRLLVAIADVAHYVAVGSALDTEAVDRGTSVYFPGRVVPMLPEVLSNGLCSLNPDVDRLCMLCELNLDADGEVTKVRFHNGIMRSHARLTYDQVHEMLTDSGSALRKQHASLMPMIEELHALYGVLASKRRERGAIEFDSNETHIVFDDNKKIKEIVPIQRNDAHKLIEECMILANIHAAAYLEAKEIPALYRVHAGPKSDRLEDLRAFLALRSLSLGGGDSPSALDYAALAEAIADRQDRSVIQTVMLRSMQQAVYQPKNEGHFGLALDHYAHFTSPIRRYPDLLVHRALKHAIAGGKAGKYEYGKDAMTALGESCSMTERRAEDASRDVVSWLKCEYMQEHVGSEFEGVISAVTSFGLFVDLVGIHVEGLLHVTNLSRDYYKFDQAAQAMRGERTGKQYRLGDPIRVQVAAVNLEERKIDFREVEQPGMAMPASQKSSGKRKDKRKDKRRGKAQAQPEHATVAAAASPAGKDTVPAHGQAGKNGKTISAEQRRQQKRKSKQKRRDQKRADRRAAKLAEEQGTATVQSSSSATRSSNAAKKSAKKRVIHSTKAAPVSAVTGSSKAKSKKKKVSGSPASKKQTALTTHTSTEAVVSQRTAKKSAANKTVSKKAAAGNVAAKTKVTKKAVAKKVAAKAAAVKKAAAKKVTAKSAVAKKVATKKAIAKNLAAKKATAKKPTAKKATTRKVAKKKATATITTARKAAAKKSNVSKRIASVATVATATKKTAASKLASKKAVSKKKAMPKANTKKARSKKSGSKKAAAKKHVSRKKTPARRRS